MMRLKGPLGSAQRCGDGALDVAAATVLPATPCAAAAALLPPCVGVVAVLCELGRTSRLARGMWRAARGAAGAERRLRALRALHGGGVAAHKTVATGPGLSHFLPPAAAAAVGPTQWLEGTDALASGSAVATPARPAARVFLESYGCQMNSNDAEVVLSVLQTAGYTRVDEPESSDVILLNTCAIRDKAEQRVWQRLAYFRSLKYAPPAGSTRRAPGDRAVVGVLGCMAERLKSKLLEADRLADIVAGPDAYRDLPRLIEAVRSDAGSKAMNVQLSADETYADIVPVRPAGAKSAFISIMRGCNNSACPISLPGYSCTTR